MNNEENNIWLSSDLHINHFNIIKYVNRPFKTSEEMNLELIKRWNSVVKPNDTVYNLGDVAFGPTYKAIEIIKQLNGHIRLLIGNHDHRNLKDKNFRNCFEWVKDYYELYYNNNLYVLSHYPFLSWSGSNRNSIMVHGHQHLAKQKENILRFDLVWMRIDSPRYLLII